MFVFQAKTHAGKEQDWKFITYAVFDAPNHWQGSAPGTYEQRNEYILQILNKDTPYAAAVPCVVCTGQDHLDEALEGIEKEDGEGLMLREPKSHYFLGQLSPTGHGSCPPLCFVWC